MLNLDKNHKYLLACSFGPDSMALFFMLLNEGYKFDVAHINYHFRNESNEEEKQLRQFCKNNHIDIYVYNNEEEVTKNLEAKAREIRYNFFYSLFANNHYDSLLVAHHKDDLLETYLMQKRKGIYVKYYGIKEISYWKEMKIIRPLLGYYKDELLDICNKNNIPYAIDQSNFDTSILRNDIRHNVVNKMNKEERDNLLKNIDEENRNIDDILSSLNNNNIHDVNYLKTLDDTALIYAIHNLLEEIGFYRISNKNVMEIKKIIHSFKANVTLKYKSYQFVKAYDEVHFSLISKEDSFSYVINEPQELDTPYFYLNFLGDTSNRHVSKDDYPLHIVNASKDMEVIINGYKVSVRRLFIDWKMPQYLRKRWPIILDKNHKPIYIPRYQKDFIIAKDLNFYVKY